jgi:hypothetical protein
MNRELAEHISLVAAPIYAEMLGQLLSIDGLHAPAELVADLRRQAIAEAHALWLQALDTEL